MFHAVDARTGLARWTYRAIDDARPGGRAEFHGTPAIVGDLIVAGCDDRDPGGIGHLYAFERATGQVRWKAEVGRGVMSDVVPRGSSVYVVTLGDELRCIDVDTGRTRWSHRSRAVLDSTRSIGFQTSPALVEDRVVFGGQDGRVEALDGERGTVLWNRDLGSPVQSGVVDSGGCVYLATQDERLVRLDAHDGRVLRELRIASRAFGPPVVTQDGVLVFVLEKAAEADEEPEPSLRCYDASLKGERWTRRLPGGWTSSRPYLWHGDVIAGGANGRLMAIRSRDGEPLWSDELHGTVRGIGLESGRLYVGTLGGTLYAYEPPRQSR